ncbi:MAG: hypothetical protein WCK82_03645 [Bacteroidota bacterium]|jgi:hypothetical protein
MKILIINKPVQTKTSSDLEHIEYREEYNEIDGIVELKQYIPEWVVKTERTKPQFNLKGGNLEFMEWLKYKEKDIERINKKLEKDQSNIRIDGIYLYDIGAMLQGVHISKDEIADAITFYPRYDYIKTTA